MRSKGFGVVPRMGLTQRKHFLSTNYEDFFPPLDQRQAQSKGGVGEILV